MTHIANYCKFPTKKAFISAVKENPERVFVEDPSIFPGSCSGNVLEVAKKLRSFCVTNHPKRSWFASVKYTEEKGLKVC